MWGLTNRSVLLASPRNQFFKLLRVGEAIPVSSRYIPSRGQHVFYDSTKLSVSSAFLNHCEFRHCVTAAVHPTAFGVHRLYSTGDGGPYEVQKMHPMGDGGAVDGIVENLIKNPGDQVEQNEVIAVIREGNNLIEVRSPGDGILESFFFKKGETVSVGAELFKIKKRNDSNSEEIKPIVFQPVGDSITEGSIGEILKRVGDYVHVDELVMTVETDKITAEIRASDSGYLKEFAVSPGDSVNVGATLFNLVIGTAPPATSTQKEDAKEKPKMFDEASKSPQKSTTEPEKGSEATETSGEKKAHEPKFSITNDRHTERLDEVIKMTSARKKTAQRLKDSQNIAAMLTTFNEVDMTNLINMRNQYKDIFFERHGVKLGFMSAFAKASAIALMENPLVNGVISGDEIITHNYVDISIAVSTPKSLVVPVIRNVELMTLADIEKKILDLSLKARANKLTMEEMTGGTFTISNGGVFGSLMGTPIINPPQSAILGMHGVVKRPHVVDGKIEARSMMYIALTYDHRLVDGREAVTALKRIKNLVEDPFSMLLDL